MNKKDNELQGVDNNVVMGGDYDVACDIVRPAEG